MNRLLTIKIAALTVAVALFCYFAYTPTVQAAPAAAKPTGKSGVKVVDPNDPNSVIYLDTSGKAAGVGDPNKPASEAYRIGKAWHPAALAAEVLPKDKYGLIDWVLAVKNGVIAPKPSLNPNAEEMPALDMDVVIVAKGTFVDDVKYPHWIHTYWFNCENCHPSIFNPARGTNNMTMVGISRGEWCGRCHGKVAFPLSDCNRCHNVKKAKK